MVLLEKITVGAAGASSVTFSSIPQTGYTDLVIKWTGRANDNGVADGFGISAFNGVTAGFTGKQIQGSGTTATSASPTGRIMVINGTAATANTFANTEIYIPNYTGSTFKSMSVDSVAENNATPANVLLVANLWSQTAAITALTFDNSTSGQNFVQYSTATLYGISKS